MHYTTHPNLDKTSLYCPHVHRSLSVWPVSSSAHLLTILLCVLPPPELLSQNFSHYLFTSICPNSHLFNLRNWPCLLDSLCPFVPFINCSFLSYNRNWFKKLMFAFHLRYDKWTIILMNTHLLHSAKSNKRPFPCFANLVTRFKKNKLSIHFCTQSCSTQYENTSKYQLKQYFNNKKRANIMLQFNNLKL